MKKLTILLVSILIFVGTIGFVGAPPMPSQVRAEDESKYMESSLVNSAFNGAAWVVSSDTNIGIVMFARILKGAFTPFDVGEHIQICDGESDQVELNAGFDAVKEHGGLVVIGGQYIVDGPWDMYNDVGVMVQGFGWTAGNPMIPATEILLADGANCNVIEIGSSPYATRPSKFLRLFNFTVNGNRANQTGTRHGINIYWVDWMKADGMRPFECRGDGFHADPKLSLGSIQNLWIVGGHIDRNDGNGINIRIREGGLMFGFTAERNVYQSNAKASVRIVAEGDNTGSIKIIGENTDTSRADGIVLLGVTGAIITSNNVHRAGGADQFSNIVIGNNGEAISSQIIIDDNGLGDLPWEDGVTRHAINVFGGSQDIKIGINNYGPTTNTTIEIEDGCDVFMVEGN